MNHDIMDDMSRFANKMPPAAEGARLMALAQSLDLAHAKAAADRHNKLAAVYRQLGKVEGQILGLQTFAADLVKKQHAAVYRQLRKVEGQILGLQTFAADLRELLKAL